MICERSVPNRVGIWTTLFYMTNVTGPLYHWLQMLNQSKREWILSVCLDALKRAGPYLSLPHDDDEHSRFHLYFVTVRKGVGERGCGLF